MILQPNTLLQGGKYRIEKLLGQGGFGITYLAEQRVTIKGDIGEISAKIKVTIKEFFMKELCDRNSNTSHVSVGSIGSRELVDRFKAKFIKEAQNIAKLKHDHIIKVLNVFEENGTAYYVMEYIDGGSLNERVSEYNALPETEALLYIRQIADALDYIHSQKINHLDVKPSNILLKEGAISVLIDFGLAKQYDKSGDQTSTTPVGISKGYAPMEQYKAGGVSSFSPASDIYSLGATLYKLVTGVTPPEAHDVFDGGLSELPASLSENVKHAITMAMQPSRSSRPQNIADFLSILNEKNEKATVLAEPQEETLFTPIQSTTAKAVNDSNTIAATDTPTRPTSKRTKKSTKKSNHGVIIGVAASLAIIISIFYFSSAPKEIVEFTAQSYADLGSPTDLSIPKGYTAIADNAFNMRCSLTSVTIPKSVTSIGDLAFAECKSLTSITIPNSVTSIGDGVFASCDKLTPDGVILNNNNFVLDQGILYNSARTKIITSLVTTVEGNVTIPNSVTSIGRKAFTCCYGLTSITIPNSVASIRAEAFQYCKSLTSITIPNSMTTIEMGIFAGCFSLTSITIPNSVTSIEAEAFIFCDSITSVYISKDSPLYSEFKNWYGDKVKTI